MTSPLTILAVDDSPDDLFVLRRLLGRSPRDITLRCVASGAEALVAFQESPVACALLDYGLPDMTGIELADALRSQPGGADIALVMLTGHGSVMIAVDAMKRGVHDYLVKGAISEASLDLAIASALERASMRRELANRQIALETSNRELERFSTMVAHDLQAPITSMEMMLHLLRDRTEAEPDLKSYVDNALSASKGMRNLVVELLDFSRAGGRAETFGPVELRSLELNVRTALAAELLPPRLLVWNADDTVYGDRVQLSQLFTNIIGNALKYHHPDRPTQVTVSSEPCPEGWMVRIEDNGRGMDANLCNRVFEPFERGANDIPGTGLGLAICRKIAEVHGATLRVQSRPGTGSVFQLTLPHHGSRRL